MTRASGTHRGRQRTRREAASRPAAPSRLSPLRPAKRREIVVLAVGLAVVSACVLAVHFPALHAKALCSDDLEYLVYNETVRNPSWRSAEKFLIEVIRPSTVGGYYQPLAMISLMLDCAMGGTEQNPLAFHRTSLAVHVANTALIIVLLYLLFGDPLAAAMAGLLFGVHPMTVEPIPWISERKTLLATFFSLWALVFYVRWAKAGSRACYGLSIGAFVLALMSKPTSTPLPVCMLIMDYWPLGRLKLKAVREKIPFFVIAGLSAVITYYSQKLTFGVQAPTDYSLWRIPLILCHNIVFYPYKILLPVNLCPHYPIPDPLSLSHPMVFAGVVGTFVLAAVLVVSLRRTRALLAGWAFFFVAIFPTMGVIGFTVVVASDKFAYLPSVGLLMLLASLLTWSWRRWQGRPLALKVRIATLSAVAVIVALESAAVRNYLPRWRDTERLNRHMLALAPGSAWVYNSLSVCLIRQGRISEAVQYLTRAVQLKPSYAEAHNSLGVALDMLGETDLAIRHFNEAIKHRPNYAAARKNLAVARARRAARQAQPTRRHEAAPAVGD